MSNRSRAAGVQRPAATRGEGVTQLGKRQQPALALVPREPATALRLLDREPRSFVLPVTQRRFVIGSAACDVTIPRHVSPAVSARHAEIERVGMGFVVRDLGSQNGTFATLRDARRQEFHVQPGDTFWIADVPLAVTDLTLDHLRARVLAHVGILADRAIDQAVSDAASGHPLLLCGPRGTGARLLARHIHDTSPQRANPRIVGPPPMCMLGHAQGTTVYIELDRLPPLPAPYAAALFDPSRGIRLIFAASDERRARRCLDHYRDRLRTIPLVPLARRLDDVPHLMQLHWSTSLASTHCIEELGADALDALTAYRWPGNLDELHDQSVRIHAYHRHGGLRRAAAALGVAHQTLADHFARIGFPVLDQLERESVPRARTRAR